MNILRMAGHIERLAQEIANYAEEYETRNEANRPIKLKRKILLRRIATLQIWLRAIEGELREGD